MLKKINNKEFNEVRNNKMVLVDFSAKWCGPCRMLHPVLDEVSELYGDKVEFYNIDVDDEPDLASEFGIYNIPAVLILKDGKLVDSSIGFRPKDQMVEFVNRNLK